MFIYVNWLTYVRVRVFSGTVIYMVNKFMFELHSIPSLSHFLLLFLVRSQSLGLPRTICAHVCLLKKNNHILFTKQLVLILQRNIFKEQVIFMYALIFLIYKSITHYLTSVRNTFVSISSQRLLHKYPILTNSFIKFITGNPPPTRPPPQVQGH